MPAHSQLSLAGEFPDGTREQWRALVSTVLRRSGAVRSGAAGSAAPGSGTVDPEAALVEIGYDGIPIAPLYTADDAVPALGLPGQSPYLRGWAPPSTARGGWDVRQRHGDPDPARTNAAVLGDLDHGVSSLWLMVGDAGVPPVDLAVALDGVHLDMAPIALDAGADTRPAARALLDLLEARAVAPAAVGGTLGADPIGLRARTGAVADLGLLGDLAAAAEPYPNLQIATVDATVYHDAGGSDCDEVAAATSVGVAYLRALIGSGLSLDRALDAVEFRFAVTADQFAGIAKLRAARRVWGRVAELCGATPTRRGQRQHAVTSAAMMTRRDPWVNMMRTTVACFAAVIGGAEAITVAPFDAAIGLPGELGHRIARNTQAILRDESGLARVADAAGGCWYVESLTDRFAETAWQKFTALERAGGALATLDTGSLSRLISVARTARGQDIAHRRAPIIGVSEFALPAEEPVRRPPAPPARTGGALSPLRYAEGFEALRDRCDAHLARHGRRPAVFLAALGPAAPRSAGVEFAANLVQVAGLAPIVAGGEPADLPAAFRAADTAVACLCSADQLPAETASASVSALRAAGAALVWTAGQPVGGDAERGIPGVDAHLSHGVDALAVLTAALDALGVA